MKIGSYQRIVSEDYDKEYQDLISKIGFTVNTAFDTVFQALNKNLSITDNLNQSVVSLRVKVDASGNPINSTQLRYTLKGNCQGIICIRAQNLTNTSSYPTNNPFISFTQSASNLLTIDNVTGLQASNEYNLTLILLGS